MNISRRLLALPLVMAGAFFAGCTVLPTGPSVMALPGSRMSVEQFQADASGCQQYANAVVAGSSGAVAQNADNAAAASAVSGALVGAATGAVIGAATGQAGQGAAIGAGTGLLFGGIAGSGYSSMSSYQLQRGYDGAYLQCMYSRGHRVPAPRGYANTARAASSYPGEAPPRYPPPNQPQPAKSSIVAPTTPVYVQPGAAASPAKAPAKYPAPTGVPPSSYPPPDAPPPASPAPRG